MGTISTAVLMCHAPIVLPSIAGEMSARVYNSTKAMTDAAEFVINSKPDVIIVLTPHMPRLREHFRLSGGKRISGDFSNFGDRWTKIDLPNSLDSINLIEKAAGEFNIPLAPTSPFGDKGGLDHGAAVPLHFMQKAGWTGETVVVGFPYFASHSQNRLFGRAIANAAKNSGKRWAIIASGDMSHRLLPDAPAGYDPDAKHFDEQFKKHLESGDLHAAVEISPQLREKAAEDVVDSVEIAGAAISFDSQSARVLSYEGPFGVGYLISILYDGNSVNTLSQ